MARYESRKFMDCISYIAVILVALVIVILGINHLVPGGFFTDSVVNILRRVAEIIGYVVLGWNSFYYAVRYKGTRRAWIFIVWIVAIILIIAFYVLGIINF